jgi:hypothetical protein
VFRTHIIATIFASFAAMRSSVFLCIGGFYHFKRKKHNNKNGSLEYAQSFFL